MSNYNMNRNSNFPAAFGGRRQTREEQPYYRRRVEREEEEDKEAKSRELNEVNFPSLGGGNAWKTEPTKKSTQLDFASLATDWKVRETLQKEREERLERERLREEREYELYQRLRPRFGYSYSNEEDTHEEEQPVEQEQKPVDEWTTIQHHKTRSRKPRIVATQVEQSEPEEWNEDLDLGSRRNKDTLW